MNLIFRNAIHVLACLGPHADDSELLLEFLGKHADFLTKSDPDCRDGDVTDENDMKPQSWITGARRRAHQWGDRFKHRKTPQPVKIEDVESLCAGVPECQTKMTMASRISARAIGRNRSDRTKISNGNTRGHPPRTNEARASSWRIHSNRDSTPRRRDCDSG